MVGVEASRPVACCGGQSDEPAIGPLVKGVDGDEPARHGHRLPIFAALFEAIGEARERFDKGPAQPLAVRLEPVVVDPRQEIAAISLDACLEDFEVGGWIVDGRLELRDVKRDEVGIEPDRPVIESEISIGIRQGVPDRVKLAAQVRQRLGVARIRPEREGDFLAGQVPIAVQDDVCEQPWVARAATG